MTLTDVPLSLPLKGLPSTTVPSANGYPPYVIEKVYELTVASTVETFEYPAFFDWD